MDDQLTSENIVSISDDIRIKSVEVRRFRVSQKTTWTCVEMQSLDGLRGIGEATIFKGHHAFDNIARRFADRLQGCPLTRIDELRPQDGSLAECAVYSAIEQAHWDILAQAAGLPVHAMLGGAARSTVPVYANINRRTVDRSPHGFIESVKKAKAAGYNTFKIAPFDQMSPEDADTANLFQKAVDRIQAAQDAMDGEGTLLIDCHWRLGQADADRLLSLAENWKLGWIECPLPETSENFPALRRYREDCVEAGIAVAGGELGTTISYFRRLIDEGLYDILMPDVKYAGGVKGLLDVEALARASGTHFSPHNPSGPVAHLASLHAMAVIEDDYLLEHQYDEAPLFWELASEALPKVAAGQSSVPKGVGLGFV